MPLADGQISITRAGEAEFVMGEGTPFEIIEFDPWTRTVRAPSQTPRAWNNGDWSGAEWGEARFVPINVGITALDDENECPPEGDFDTWIDHQFALAAAFAPVEDSNQQVELKFRFGSREFRMFGRPRMMDPMPQWLSWVKPGNAPAQLAFVALDPVIFGQEVEFIGEDAVRLPIFSGGLTVNGSGNGVSAGLIVPFTIDTGVSGGEIELTNEGTAEAGLLLRVHGPVDTPIITLIRTDGIIQSIRVGFFIEAGEFVDIDTAARTAFLNGDPTTSVRGFITGDFPLLPQGTSVLRYRAGSDFHPDAILEITFSSTFK